MNACFAKVQKEQVCSRYADNGKNMYRQQGADLGFSRDGDGFFKKRKFRRLFFWVDKIDILRALLKQ